MVEYLRRRTVLKSTATGIVGALSGCLTILPGSNGSSSGGDNWPQYGYGAANTGYSPAGLLPHTDSVDWLYERDGQVTTTPISGDGLVYAGWSEGLLQDGTVVACDVGTGEMQWEYDAGAFLPASFALVDGVLYAISGNGVLHALDGDNGSELWSLTLASGGGSAPTVAGGALVASYSDTGGQSYAMGCVDLETRRVDWTRPHTGSRTPAVSDGAVYVSDRDGALARVDIETGDETWRIPVDRGHLSTPVLDGEMAYIRWTPGVLDDEEPPKLVAIDMDGDERWRASLQGEVSSCDLAVADGSVYALSFEFGANDERGTTWLTAIDGSDGTVRWTVEEPGAEATTFVGPAIVDEIVFVSYFDGTVTGYETIGGEAEWTIDLDEIVQTGPALASERLFVGTQAGALYAFGG